MESQLLHIQILLVLIAIELAAIVGIGCGILRKKG